MGTKGWIIFTVVVVGFLGGLVYLSGKDRLDVSKVDEKSIIAKSKDSGNIEEHVFGNKDSKVILIEYGDFQCPACGGAHPNIKRITETYKDKIMFIFRNFPLTSLHPNALAASAAVESAGFQDKYWEMHNAVFENQDDWKDDGPTERTQSFVDLAKAVGVKDIDKFKEDLSSDAISKKIKFDVALAKKIGASSTPTLVLNNTIISEEITGDAVQSSGNLLEEEIKKLLK